ncbi:alcohol dehydrogenase catalytic domain-containing protein [Arthrobacter sp. JCM 19049]|uniref:alcohol dehydrogenase catalytic domain-containing protein n=1 Tax=Arthrobacter sp. JCM 19049 TaxID=1460643 RepID=UPI0035B5118C
MEGVGVVEGTGDGVSRFAVGQRVGWMAGGQGSFSDYVLVDQMKAVGLPDSIEDEVAAASLMQALPPTISPPIRTPSPKATSW